MAQALSASKALVWDAVVFESIAQRIPVLRHNTTDILLRRLEDLEERFREVSTEKVSARLSHEIVRLLNQVGRRVNGVVEIRLSREELAQLVGTTLFTVSRLLSEWDQQGIVSARREAVSVCNLHALVELSEIE
jgi:CRP-like cAMP-binding protein